MGILFCTTIPKQRAPTCAKKEQLQGAPLLPPRAESALYLSHNHFKGTDPNIVIWGEANMPDEVFSIQMPLMSPSF